MRKIKLLFWSRTFFYAVFCSISIQPLTQADDSFAAFKETVVETDCAVPRIGEFPPYGRVQIGPEGGAELIDDEAETAYQCILEEMREGYGKADNQNAQNFLDWTRVSTIPYVSRAHHNRYIHHYANDLAREHYLRFEQVGTMPEGAVLAKDSFVVTKQGRVVVSALSIMEKRAPGYNPETGDWHFMLILPDGRIFGDSEDSNAFAVEFCNDCHQNAGAEQDYLFFMPRRYRPDNQ